MPDIVKYRYEPIHGVGGIRLLILHPGGHDDLISCDLIPACLPSLINVPTDQPNLEESEIVGYEALSYVWGNPDHTAPVQCGNGVIEVTRNLFVALGYLRDLSVARVFWIDALCINQGDITERESQVQLMGHIYSSASKTTIWLGEETDEVKGWTNALVELQQCVPQHIILSDSYYAGIGPEQNPLLNSPYWNPVVALLRRPWFRRKWVIQEVTKSKNPFLCCGHENIIWTALEELLVCLAQTHACGNVFLALKDNATHQVIENAASLAKLRSLASEQEPLKLDLIIFECANFRCSDQRDHLNALLGLAADIDSASTLCRPNYTSSAEEVFINFSLWAIVEQKSLKHLNWRTDSAEIELDLPSWVPNISGFGFNEDNRHTYLGFHASLDTQTCANLKDGLHLSMMGKPVDEISRVGELEFALPNEPFSSEKGWINAGQRWHWWRDECKEMAFDQTGTDEIKGHPLFDAFWRTLVWDSYRDAGRAKPDLGNEIYRYLEELCNVIHVEDYLTKLDSIMQFVDTVSDADAAIKKYCSRRRFSTTVNNRFASVPNTAKLGDRICILYGGDLPFVLRQCGEEEFRLIGPCYLHGMMDGEAMKMEELKEQTFTIV